MKIQNDYRINILPDVLSQKIDDETVILDLRSEAYFSLNEIGTRFWQMIEEYGNRNSIIGQLLEEFDVDAEVLNKDIDELMGKLVDAGLVSVVSRD